MPNQDCLNCSQTINEIALLDNSVKAFDKAFQLQSDTNVILFILIEGGQQFSGVCKLQSPVIGKEIKEDWSQHW